MYKLCPLVFVMGHLKQDTPLWPVFFWLIFLSMDTDSNVTYGPHKAVAEVSNHNEPIGRKSGIQLVRKSMDFTFNCSVLN